MYEGMFMYGCVCVSLGDGGSVGSQGRTGGGCGEAGQVLSLAVLFCLAKISVYAYKKNCKGKGYCKGMGIRVRSETYKIGGGFRVQKHVGGIILR